MRLPSEFLLQFRVHPFHLGLVVFLTFPVELRRRLFEAGSQFHPLTFSLQPVLHLPRFAVDLLVAHAGGLNVLARDSRNLRRAGFPIYPQRHATLLHPLGHANPIDRRQVRLRLEDLPLLQSVNLAVFSLGEVHKHRVCVDLRRGVSRPVVGPGAFVVKDRREHLAALRPFVLADPGAGIFLHLLQRVLDAGDVILPDALLQFLIAAHIGQKHKRLRTREGGVPSRAMRARLDLLPVLVAVPARLDVFDQLFPADWMLAVDRMPKLLFRHWSIDPPLIRERANPFASRFAFLLVIFALDHPRIGVFALVITLRPGHTESVTDSQHEPSFQSNDCETARRSSGFNLICVSPPVSAGARSFPDSLFPLFDAGARDWRGAKPSATSACGAKSSLNGVISSPYFQ